MKILLPYLVCCWVFLGLAARAQNSAAADFKSAKQIIELVPRQQLMQFRTSSLMEGARASANKILDAKVKGKRATLRVKVSEWKAWEGPGGELGIKFRMDTQEQTVNQNGVSIGVRFYVFLPADQEQALARVPKGQEISVTGTLTRADFTANANEGLKLNLDLLDTKIERR